MPPFTPAHDQPVTLAQLRLLEPELLSNGALPSRPAPPVRPRARTRADAARALHTEIARLQNSIAHLERSNGELRAFVRGEGDDDGDSLDDDTRREFEDTVRENEETIACQQERIEMIRVALEEQVGVDARNPHYIVAGSAPTAARVSPPPAVHDDGDEVMGVAAASARTTAAPPPLSSPNVNGAQLAGDDDDGMYL
ncbi:hypothetical protein JCM3770_001468 [Rhodotorula araucariae]